MSWTQRKHKVSILYPHLIHLHQLLNWVILLTLIPSVIFPNISNVTLVAFILIAVSVLLLWQQTLCIPCQKIEHELKREKELHTKIKQHKKQFSCHCSSLFLRLVTHMKMENTHKDTLQIHLNKCGAFHRNTVLQSHLDPCWTLNFKTRLFKKQSCKGFCLFILIL